MKISLYKNVYEKQQTESIDVYEFFNKIKTGYWQDLVNEYRVTKIQSKKLVLSAVTISGVFNGARSDSAIGNHSGLIAIDIDNIDYAKIHSKIIRDKYTFGFFMSCGGNGACVVVRIDKRKHRQSFYELVNYYNSNYGLVVDLSGVNESRLRFVSYDPHLFFNQNSEVFKCEEKIDQKQLKEASDNILIESDLIEIIDRVIKSGVNITKDKYDLYLRFGFAFADHLGEKGRQLYHSICSTSNKYIFENCEKQYNLCLSYDTKSIKESKSHIATFLYHCGLAGISINANNSKKIMGIAAMSKSSGQTKENTAQTIEVKFGIKKEEAEKITERVYSEDGLNKKDNILGKGDMSALISYLSTFHPTLSKCEITGKIFLNNIEMDQELENSLLVECKLALGSNIKENYETYLKSSFVKKINSIENSFKSLEYKGDGHLEELLNTIGATHELDRSIIKKWLIGVCSTKNEFMFIMCGEQGWGKTAFFENLLPQKLSGFQCDYFFTGFNNDMDVVALSKYLILFDDECRSFNKNFSADDMKQVITATSFNHMAKYQTREKKNKKIASLCGTKNEINFLREKKYNRKFYCYDMPFKMDVDHYISIDKEALWAEIYDMYISGEPWRLSEEEKTHVQLAASNYYSETIEEMAMSKFVFAKTKEDENSAYFMTTYDIYRALVSDGHPLKNFNSRVIGNACSAHGIKSVVKKINGKTERGYYIISYK